VAGNQTVLISASVENYPSGHLDTYADLFVKLGKHKVGKGCLYLKRLSDVDLDVLRKVVGRSVTTSRAMGE